LEGDFESWYGQFNKAQLKGLKLDKRRSKKHEGCKDNVDGNCTCKKNNADDPSEVRFKEVSLE
jgi:hypothetical protein